MKKLIFLLAGLLAVTCVAAGTKATAVRGISKPTVDRRVELVTLVARLAGYEEFQSKAVPAYSDAIEAWFAPYKKHPAILYMKKLRNEADMGYNAIPIMGVYLTEPPKLRPRLPLTASQPESRWGVQRGTEFIKLLDKFYKDARCEEFFAQQAPLFGQVEEAFGDVFAEIDMEWFPRFFGGESKGGMVPIIGMGFGGGNFGGQIVYPDSTVDQYAFMGSWGMRDGKPKFNREGFLNTIVHEFSHSFVNPALNAESGLAWPASEIFRAKAEEMQAQAYTSGRTVLNETFVRAAVIRYLMAHADSTAVNNEMLYQIDRHFIWMPEAVELLGEYEANRDKYPDFRSFTPRVVEFCNEVSTQMSVIERKREKEKAIRSGKVLHVVAVEPFGNGAQDVDPDLTDITIRFDRPVVGRGYAFNPGPGGMDKLFDFVEAKGYSDDNTAFTIVVKLQPDHEYEFYVLHGLSFVTPDGIHMTEDYLVKFRTRAK